MTQKTIEPDVVAIRIREAIESTPRRSRRIRCHRLFEEIGFERRNATRETFLSELLERHGIDVTPTLVGAGRDDWLVLHLKDDQPRIPAVGNATLPSDEWFRQLEMASLETEREVEMHFVSPLFRALGYTEEQEAAGHPVIMWEGVSRRVAEADLVYFETGDHAAASGNALVLVECKSPVQHQMAGVGQARSYALWVHPAYYVVTNGIRVTAFMYLGPVQDKQVLDVSRSDLRGSFQELHAVLGFTAAVAAKRQLAAKFAPEEVRTQNERPAAN